MSHEAEHPVVHPIARYRPHHEHGWSGDGDDAGGARHTDGLDDIDEIDADGSFGTDDRFAAQVGGASAARYGAALIRARRLAADMQLTGEEVDRLEALAEGRGPAPVWRWLRPAAALGTASVVPGLAWWDSNDLAVLPVLAGIGLQAAWCGDRAGLALRRRGRARGFARLGETMVLALFVGLAAFAAVAAHALGPWPAALGLVLGAGLSVLAGYAGSSGDPVAERIHGELAAARRAARRAEDDLLDARLALRAAHSADLSTLSMVAPWPRDDARSDAS